MPNNYSRNTRQYPDKIERNHLCPLCGAYVMPFLGVLGTEHKGHCPKCGTVTYVSMPETVTHEFTSYIRAELEQEQHKALKIVLDVTTGPQEPPQDYRIFNKRQADGTFRPLSEFFEGKKSWQIEAEAQAADANDYQNTISGALEKPVFGSAKWFDEIEEVKY